jgi:hypothetical protein
VGEDAVRIIYLLVVDYYSNYIELTRLQDKTAASVLANFKVISARHGIPQELLSDNMPFNSREFSHFAQGMGPRPYYIVTHIYPQSNGLAEISVETVKNLI